MAIATTTAILAAGGLAAAGGIAGAAMGSSAAKSAANKQAAAADAATQLEREQWEWEKEALAPWREQGTKALNYLSKMIEAGPGGTVRTATSSQTRDEAAYQSAIQTEMERRRLSLPGSNDPYETTNPDNGTVINNPNYLGTLLTPRNVQNQSLNEQDIAYDLFYNPDTGQYEYPMTGGGETYEAVPSTEPYGGYEKSPYYDFLVSEGAKGLERGAAAKGMQLSGAEEKALIGYDKNMASTDYDTWLNNWYKSLTPWQSLAGVGQTAVNSTVQASQNYSQGASQNILNAGNAKAAGQLGQANTYANLLNWGGQQGANYLLYSNLLNQNGLSGASGSGGGNYYSGL